jgi:hypothetical protein
VASKPWQTNTNHYAVVVGINDYPLYENLKGPIADAQEFIKWLCEEESGGGLPDNNCKRILWISNPTDPEAVQDRIDYKLEELMKQVGSGAPAQRLYLYFSGHGIGTGQMATAMCASNWDYSWGKDRALNSQQYLEALLQSGRFLEVVMFLDCCRVRLVSAKGRGPAGWPVNPEHSPKCRQFQADATEFTNRAFEVAVQTPGASNPVVRGYFTRALLEALRGAAAADGGGVPAGNLKKYLEKRVPQLAIVDGYLQQPEIVNGLPSDPEPIFGSAKPGDGGPGSGSIRPSPTQPPLQSSPKELMLPVDLFHVGKELSLRKPVYRSAATPRGGTRKALNAADILSLTRTFSATPLSTRAGTKDAYVNGSEVWSKRETRAPIVAGAKESLFIFIRAVSPTRYKAHSRLFHKMELVGSSGRVITKFTPKELKSDLKKGWSAFHAKMAKGTYYLRFTGNPTREVPIAVFPRWQTQLFFLHKGETLFETLKIFIEKPGFRPADPETTACDLALNGLQNHQDLLDKKTLDILLHGKFNNPMLGLVGAHILLQRPPTNTGNIIEVLRNLHWLLPESIDLDALACLASAKGIAIPWQQDRFRFDRPPMLKASLDAVIQASIAAPEVIESSSRIPMIAAHVFADSPWTSWEIIRSKTNEPQLTFVHASLLNELRAKAKRQPNLTRFDSKAFAARLGVPPQSVNNAIRDLDHSPMKTIAAAFPNEFPEFLTREETKRRAWKPKKIQRGWFSSLLHFEPKVDSYKASKITESTATTYTSEG